MSFRAFRIPAEDLEKAVVHPILGLVVYVESLRKVFIVATNNTVLPPETSAIELFDTLFASGNSRIQVARFLSRNKFRPSQYFVDKVASKPTDLSDEESSGAIVAEESSSVQTTMVNEGEWLADRQSDEQHNRLSEIFLGNPRAAYLRQSPSVKLYKSYVTAVQIMLREKEPRVLAYFQAVPLIPRIDAVVGFYEACIEKLQTRIMEQTKLLVPLPLKRYKRSDTNVFYTTTDSSIDKRLTGAAGALYVFSVHDEEEGAVYSMATKSSLENFDAKTPPVKVLKRCGNESRAKRGLGPYESLFVISDPRWTILQKECVENVLENAPEFAKDFKAVYMAIFDRESGVYGVLFPVRLPAESDATPLPVFALDTAKMYAKFNSAYPPLDPQQISVSEEGRVFLGVTPLVRQLFVITGRGATEARLVEEEEVVRDAELVANGFIFSYDRIKRTVTSFHMKERSRINSPPLFGGRELIGICAYNRILAVLFSGERNVTLNLLDIRDMHNIGLFVVDGEATRRATPYVTATDFGVIDIEGNITSYDILRFIGPRERRVSQKRRTPPTKVEGEARKRIAAGPPSKVKLLRALQLLLMQNYTLPTLHKEITPKAYEKFVRRDGASKFTRYGSIQLLPTLREVMTPGPNQEIDDIVLREDLFAVHRLRALSLGSQIETVQRAIKMHFPYGVLASIISSDASLRVESVARDFRRSFLAHLHLIETGVVKSISPISNFATDIELEQACDVLQRAQEGVKLEQSQ